MRLPWLSVGGLVLTTATIYYGGPTLFAGLSSLVTSIALRFRKNGQDTALSQIGQTFPVSTELDI